MTYVQLKLPDDGNITLHIFSFERYENMIHISGMVNKKFAWLNRKLEENKNNITLKVGLLEYRVDIVSYVIYPEGKGDEQISKIDIEFEIKGVNRNGEVPEMA